MALLLVPLLLCSCAPELQIPQALQAPAGQKSFLHAYAKGVQIYRSETDPAGPGHLIWKLKGPEALLFDDCGNVIGSHYAGPIWELDGNKSRITGDVLEKAPAPDGTAIPWLLLRAKSVGGPGLLRHTTYIQRIKTTGGLPPVETAVEVGQEARSHYTAEYVFYRSKN